VTAPPDLCDVLRLQARHSVEPDLDEPEDLARIRRERELLVRALQLLVAEARVRVGGLPADWPSPALVIRLSRAVRHACTLADEALELVADQHHELEPLRRADADGLRDAIVRHAGSHLAWPLLCHLITSGYLGTCDHT
jgi:hypothetical protein